MADLCPEFCRAVNGVPLTCDLPAGHDGDHRSPRAGARWSTCEPITTEPISAARSQPGQSEHSLPDLNAEGRVSSEREELEAHGYKEIPAFGYLMPGVRVRHIGEQYPAAYDRGTAVVIAVYEKDPSSWSASYGKRDIEVIVERDKPMFEGSSPISQWANYHCVVVTPWPAKEATNA